MSGSLMKTAEVDDMNTNWTSNASPVDLEESPEAFSAFIVHQSGGQRGTMHRLNGDTVCISQNSDVGTHVARADYSPQRESSYEHHYQS